MGYKFEIGVLIGIFALGFFTFQATAAQCRSAFGCTPDQANMVLGQAGLFEGNGLVPDPRGAVTPNVWSVFLFVFQLLSFFVSLLGAPFLLPFPISLILGAIMYLGFAFVVFRFGLPIFLRIIQAIGSIIGGAVQAGQGAGALAFAPLLVIIGVVMWALLTGGLPPTTSASPTNTFNAAGQQLCLVQAPPQLPVTVPCQQVGVTPTASANARFCPGIPVIDWLLQWLGTCIIPSGGGGGAG